MRMNPKQLNCCKYRISQLFSLVVHVVAVRTVTKGVNGTRDVSGDANYRETQATNEGYLENDESSVELKLQKKFNYYFFLLIFILFFSISYSIYQYTKR